MPNEPGIFDSPGARARSERFSRQRAEVVDFLGPFVVDGLRSAAEATDESLTQLSQTQGLFNLRAPTVEPRLRPTPPATLTPTATPTPERPPVFGLEPPTLRPAPSRPAFRAVDEPIGLPPPPGQLVGEERRPPSPLLAADARTERIRTRGIAEDTLPSVGELLRAEVEAGRFLTEPIGRFVGRRIGEQLAPTTPPVLSALGVGDIPGTRRAGDIGEAVGGVVAPEVLVLSNLVPVPILDDALRILAKGAPLAGRLLTREGRTATRAELGELITGARRFLTGTVDPADRQLVEQALEGLVAERPLAGAAGEAEQTAAREAAAAPPGPPAQTATGSELPGRGNAGAKAALALKEETLLEPGRVTQLPGIKQVTSGLNPSVDLDRKVLVSYNARQAVTSSLETEFAAARQRVVRDLQKAWDEELCT